MENAKATREEVDVVEAFFKDNASLDDPVALVIMVDNKELVRLVLVDTELRKDLIFLNVFGWEAYRIRDVAKLVFCRRSKVEQDDLGAGRLRRWSPRWIVALAQYLYVIEVAAHLHTRSPLNDVVGKCLWRNSSEVFALASHQAIFSGIQNARLLFLLPMVDLGLDVHELRIGQGPFTSLVLIAEALAKGKQVKA